MAGAFSGVAEAQAARSRRRVLHCYTFTPPTRRTDAQGSGRPSEAGRQMVSNGTSEKTTKRSRASRAIYTCIGLGVISTAVAVLGAPLKW